MPRSHEVDGFFGTHTVRYVEPDPELAGGIHRQPPPAGIPRQHRTLLNRLARIGNQGADVDLGPDAQAVAGWADAVWVVSARTSDEAGDHREDLLARRLCCGADPDLPAAPEHADPVGESEHLVE